MRDIIFRADLFANERDRARSEAVLQLLLAALVDVNVDFLRLHPSTPSLYRSGVRYQREKGTEIWKAIPDLYRDRFGDCEDLAAARTAELRIQGVNARPFVKHKRKGDFVLYHVQVQYPDGKIEDPSRELGMEGEG